jgi:AraC-like DNA-binding protein
MVWRGRVEQDYAPVCPADPNWNLLFTWYQDRVRVTAEGATTAFVPKIQRADAEFLVIKFALGVFLPNLPALEILNGDAALPEAAGQSFWLNGFSWDLPHFDNVETFVERLVREDVLLTDPIVRAALADEQLALSSRTVRRRFLQATGLTPKTIQQIERAKQAAAMLAQGLPILDAVYELGYADQPHMTRSLRRFYGQTPAQIAQAAQPA